MTDADRLARALAALDHLDAVEREATPGPWIDAGDGEALGAGGEGGYAFRHALDADLDAIVALRNLARPLLDLARGMLDAKAAALVIWEPLDADDGEWEAALARSAVAGRRVDAALDALIDALADAGDTAP